MCHHDDFKVDWTTQNRVIEKSAMKTWGDVFNHYKRKGCDPSDAAYRADQWEQRKDRKCSLSESSSAPQSLG